MNDHYALGIDIGGTSTEYGLVSQDGDIIYEKDVPTKDFPEPQQLIDAIHADLLK